MWTIKYGLTEKQLLSDFFLVLTWQEKNAAWVVTNHLTHCNSRSGGLGEPTREHVWGGQSPSGLLFLRRECVDPLDFCSRTSESVPWSWSVWPRVSYWTLQNPSSLDCQTGRSSMYVLEVYRHIGLVSQDTSCEHPGNASYSCLVIWSFSVIVQFWLFKIFLAIIISDVFISLLTNYCCGCAIIRDFPRTLPSTSELHSVRAGPREVRGERSHWQCLRDGSE